jgi:hypothetical protein
MKLWFAKVRRGEKAGLIPTDEDSRALVNRLSDGECVEVEVSRPRSVPFNRLYWGLCRTIGENQDPPRDEDSIDAELRVLAGHYEVIHVAGHEVRIPKRIAFNKMNADQWNEYFRKAEVAIAERFGAEYLPEIAA